MTNIHWTPILVEERMAEAAEVLARLPEVKVQGYFSTWPPMVREFWESFGWNEPTLRRPWPSPAAIDRMDETLTWLAWLETMEARIVWLRAQNKPWKIVCREAGLQRSSAHVHWMYGLCVIALRLNRQHVPKRRSKRHVIELARSVCGDVAA